MGSCGGNRSLENATRTLPELADNRATTGTGACVWKAVTISLEVLITATISKQLLKL